MPPGPGCAPRHRRSSTRCRFGSSAYTGSASTGAAATTATSAAIVNTSFHLRLLGPVDRGIPVGNESGDRLRRPDGAEVLRRPDDVDRLVARARSQLELRSEAPQDAVDRGAEVSGCLAEL